MVAAARALHVTTSAVSQQLGRLEREVGQALVERQGRGIRLTETGLLLARHAGDLIAHVERVEAVVAEHRGAVVGTLSVAAFATAARGLLPAVLRDLRTRHPDLTVSLSEQEPHQAVPALRRGLVDLAVVQDWPGSALPVPTGVSRRDLFDDRYDVALPLDHPLADRDRLRLADLGDQEWISWSADEICHDWLVRTFRAIDGRARVRHTASEHATQLALVAAGLGIALMPRLGREPSSPAVRFLPIEPAPVRRVCAVWRTSATGRPAVAAAVAALRRHSPVPAVDPVEADCPVGVD